MTRHPSSPPTPGALWRALLVVAIGCSGWQNSRGARGLARRSRGLGGIESPLLFLARSLAQASWARRPRAPHDSQRHQRLRNQLGGVEVVERESGRFLLHEKLNGEFQFWNTARFDGLKQVAPVAVRVSPGNLDGLVPHRRLQTGLGPTVKLHKGGFSCALTGRKL
jgi:hypothetical protein